MLTTSGIPSDLSADTVAQLPDDTALLKSMIAELLELLQQRDRDNQDLRHRLDLLLRRLYGPRSEHIDPSQLLLFADPAPTPDASPAPPPPQPRRRCKPHGRRRLPEHLPRIPQHHELSAAQRICPGCGQTRIDIGVDRSEQLDYRPASLFVIEHLVHKYVCPCCRPGGSGEARPARPLDPDAEVRSMSVPDPCEDRPAEVPPPTEMPAAPVVVRASRPADPIRKGLPGSGLLAHLIVSKFVDHLPLHRLERVYQRQGLFLPRSTLCDWLGACGALLKPLYDRMVEEVLRSRALHTDDTIVKLKDPGTRRLSTARMWTYLGDTTHPYNVFDFTPNRRRDGPQKFLERYQGYLHADAFSGYDRLYVPDGVTAAGILEVACNAHARRKFYDARDSDVLRAHQALGYYRQLYALEQGARAFSESQRLQMRQELALPILARFQAWMEQERGEVLPKSPMGEALGYALNNWAALVRYTEAGFLTIDNNVAEREMKRIAIGRKNWLFVGSPQGGRTAAILMSVTSTCNRLGVEPWSYLQDVLRRLPTTPGEQLEELLPRDWLVAHPDQTATAGSNRTPEEPEADPES